MNHLFKLKKDGKTVGYLELYQDGNLRLEYNKASCPWVHTGWPSHLRKFLNEEKVTSIHPFVCKDKNKKDVFADDKVDSIGNHCLVMWHKVLLRWCLWHIEGDYYFSAVSKREFELIEEQDG